MKTHWLWIVFLSAFSSLLRPAQGFPLRSIGQTKNASVAREKREPVLCWVIQIRLGLRCLDDEGYQGTQRCTTKHVSRHHYEEIAKELNLVTVHIFSEFPNHALMCFLEEKMEEKIKGQILSLSSIQDLSLGFLKTENESAFQHVKNSIEGHLSSHEEIVMFHAEHTHLRKSRVNIPLDKIDWYAQKNHLFSFLHSETQRKHQEVKLDLTKPKEPKVTTQSVKDLIEMFSLLKNCINISTSSFSKEQSLDNIREIRFYRDTTTFTGCLLSVYCHKVFQPMSSIEKLLDQSPDTAKKICDVLLKDFKTLRINKLSEKFLFYLKESSVDGIFMDKNSTRPSCKFMKCLFLYSMLSSICSDMTRPTINCFDMFKAVIKNINGIQCNEVFQYDNYMKSTNNGAILGYGKSFKYLLKLFESISTTTVFIHRILAQIVCHDNFLSALLCKNRTPVDVYPYLQEIVKSFHASNDNILSRKASSSVFERSFQAWLRSSSSYEDRKKRSSSLPPAISFNDPAFHRQWHLHNRATPSMDINVTGVWIKGYNGSGVTVAVVDDGLQWQNPDLKDNYEYRGSWDLNDNDPDPSPSTMKTANHHGTRCAGEIAAVANNKRCGVGVAYGAKVSGLRVLDGVMTDSLEAEAFNKGMEINDIYSCSWGPDDDGKTLDGPHLMAAKAMRHGVEFGRRGFGSIFVVASGNGGFHKDNCNFDGYANSIYTVTIGAVDESGAMPYYAEECASMLGVTFSSGTINKRDIVTTDWTFHNPTGCTEKHTGTSAAAPLAAGMIALMLQARPCLTWRDVQYIIILTAKKVDIDIAHWQQNGAGLSHSHKHGFGLLSSWRMVNAARVWKAVPWMTSYSHTLDLTGSHLDIPKGGEDVSLVVWHEVKEEDIKGYSLFTLESVQVSVWLSHPYRGKLSIKLNSPSNTVSVIAAPRPNDNSSSGFHDWTFTTVRCWGESPVGNWTLVISDTDNDNKYTKGRFTQWRLTLLGTPMSRSEFDKRRKLVESAMSGQYLDSNHTLHCPLPPQKTEEVAMFSEKTLKILILSGFFCLIMGVYQTFEYILCYNTEKEEYQQEVEQARRNQRLMERTMSALEDEYSTLPVTADSGSNSIIRGFRSNSSDLSTYLNRDDFNSNHAADVINHLDDNDDDDDDDEEDDIFNASETRRLLNDNHSNSSSRLPFFSRTRLSPSPNLNSHFPMNSASSLLNSEAIQLATFKTGTISSPDPAGD